MVQGRKAGMLSYGHGCHLYSDCFTCPGPPKCVVQYGANKKQRIQTERIWKPVFERALSQVGGKG